MNRPMTQGYYFANVKCYFFISPTEKKYKNPINILTTTQSGPLKSFPQGEIRRPPN